MEIADTHDTPPPRTLMVRPLNALVLLAGRVRALAVPVVATGCIAAMSQPSPTTAFVLAVAIELGGSLLRAAAHGVFNDRQ